jgi:transcription antitermination factor NusG
MQLVLSEKSWFAVQVTPRHEKKIEVILGLRFHEHFLPKYQARRKWSDRVKTIEEPLFPGYVFVKIMRSVVGEVLAIPGVIRIVNFGGKPCPVPEEEIAAWQLVCHSNRDMCAFPYLNTGQRVQVVAGPLSGVTGIIMDWKKHDRLIVNIDLIMKSVSVEVDRMEVAPIYPRIVA